MFYQDKYLFIISEEEKFKTARTEVAGSYFWSFFEHILKTVLYKNSQFFDKPDNNKPFKNIIRPILNLQYRAEGFDVKDIELFIKDSEKYFKSFLIRKYHESWAREEEIDTFIDAMVESYVDFGGALVKKKADGAPELVPLQRIAFCDQTDILAGTICEKHFYSPSQLLETATENGWDYNKAKLLVELCELEKKESYANTGTETPSPYVAIYELHGNLPVGWLDDEDSDYENKEYSPQVHICGFFKMTEKKGEYKNNGITLFSAPEKKPRYKFIARDAIYGRALGMGGAEELFQDQVWTNYAEIHKKYLMDSASKTIFQTADQMLANKNNINSLGNNAILVHEAGKPLTQVNTYPTSFALFDNLVNEWQAHAQQMGAASDPILGEEPKSGVPFRLQALVTQEAHSLHEYRKGKLATFLDEIYRDWIIPGISKQIVGGKEFVAELDLDELQNLADSLVICETNKVLKDGILEGVNFTPEQVESFKQTVRESFMKGDKRKFFEILKDEMKNIPIDVKVNIAGKQKYSQLYLDKLNNVFRTIAANPQILQVPGMAKLFNEILEAGGLSPIDFPISSLPQPQMQSQPQMVANQMPVK